MRLNSLALRLFFSATTWTVVILVVTGVVLSSLYRAGGRARLRPPARRLSAHPGRRRRDARGERRQVSPVARRAAVRAAAVRLVLAGDAARRADAGRALVALAVGRRRCRISPTSARRRRPAARARAMPRGPRTSSCASSSAPSISARRGAFSSRSPATPAEIDEETRAFDGALVITFGVLALVLLLTTTFQVRFGLAPLKRISEGLAAIRSGTAERLEGAFPVEIAPLARETNALIDANREIVDARAHPCRQSRACAQDAALGHGERGRRRAGRRSARAEGAASRPTSCATRSTRHLERARLAARVAVIGTVTDVGPVVIALARTMEKIHHHRGVAIDIDAPEDARFRGEQQDLEEMVGNLVDNACKWAQSRVSVEVFSERPDPADDRRVVRIWSTTTGRACRRSSASRSPAAAAGSTRPSRARGSGFRSWSSSPASMAAGSRSAPRRSAACAPSWCCRGRSQAAEAVSQGAKGPIVSARNRVLPQLAPLAMGPVPAHDRLGRAAWDRRPVSNRWPATVTGA